MTYALGRNRSPVVDPVRVLAGFALAVTTATRTALREAGLAKLGKRTRQLIESQRALTRPRRLIEIADGVLAEVLSDPGDPPPLKIRIVELSIGPNGPPQALTRGRVGSQSQEGAA